MYCTYHTYRVMSIERNLSSVSDIYVLGMYCTRTTCHVMSMCEHDACVYSGVSVADYSMLTFTECLFLLALRLLQ